MFGQINTIDNNINSSSFSAENLNFSTGEIYVIYTFEYLNYYGKANLATNLVNYPDYIENQNLVIFPNPVSDYFQIESSIDLFSATIYNSDGRTITTVKVEKNEIDVSYLNPGFYTIIFNNDKTLTKKIVKK